MLYIVGIIVLGPLLVAPITASWLPHAKPAPIGTVNGPSVYVSNAFGGSNVQVVAGLCAGKVSLAQGSATVNDSCFTGDTNIVICSDLTSVSPARCVPGRGSLAVDGRANDTVAYARVK